MRKIFLLFFIPAALFAETLTGVVVGVSDGDTVTLLTAKREQVKIRLYGIDAPESKQAFGQRSKQALSSLVFQKEVKAEVKNKDRYGRSVAVIFVGSVNVNEAQVQTGMAWWYVQYAKKDKRLGELQDQAKQAKLGLWSEPTPVAPWEFRRGASAK